MSIKGNALKELIRVEGYPRYFNDGTTQTLEDRRVCLWTSWPGLIPAIGSSISDLAGVFLKEVRVERDGVMATVSLLYAYPDPLQPGVDAGDTYESRASVSIDEDGARVPSITWVRRMRKTTFTMDESNVTENVGKRVNPPGMISPSANKWLKTGRDVSKGADYTQIVDSYEWRGTDWDEAYGNGTET